ncbi:MAG: efflux RND transporter permease subunit [Candidatus Hydrogenedentes bacterium]|nr:efflux RND transporter permease subunit [Candidatus Hydrogenedentota bacterium]
MDDSTPQTEKQYRLAIRRPVTMAMMFVTLIVFGWRSYQQLAVNLMPDISYPTLTVRTEYEGAAPEDVEKLVTRPLEEMLSIVGGMVEISSISSPGISEIVLEFTWDTDMNVAQQDVRDRLDLFDPPRELTEKPVILRYDPTLDPVMRVAVAPDFSKYAGGTPAKEEQYAALTAIREAADRQLKSDLEAETGVAQVAVKGGQEEEIQVLVDSQRVKNLGLSLDMVVNALAQQNINLSGGKLQEGRTEYLVRTLNEFASVEEIAGSIMSLPTGSQMRLDDVARVFLGTKERETIVRINQQEAVALDIYKEGDANTVEVANTVKDLLGLEREVTLGERIAKIFSEAMMSGGAAPAGAVEKTEEETANAARQRTLLDRLPANVNLSVITDQSRFITGSINEVKNATVVGGFLALLVLFVFLREMKSTLIIGVTIPISVVASFVPMFMGGITLNIMSLGGLALGVGMLVDNAIVVLESIFRCKEEGDGPVDAAERGTHEVSSAVISSTLTTVAVFLPIAFVEGIAGQLFRDLALTVTFSLLASLLAALYLIPLIVSRRGLTLDSSREVIWVLRAYRESRATGTTGKVSAALQVPLLGMRYAVAGARTAFHENFLPLTSAWAEARETRRPGARIWALVFTLISPAILVLYLFQLLLSLVGALLTAIILLICGIFLAIYLPVRAALRILFWVPLQLFDVGFTGFRDLYAAVLTRSLRFSVLVLMGLVALSIHAGYTALSLGSELIPPMKQGEFGLRLEAPAGTRLEQTEARAGRVEEVLRSHPLVASVTVEIGEEDSSTSSDRGENMADFTIALKDPENNALIQDSVIEELRLAVQKVSSEEITFSLPTLFSFKTAIELQVVGDDLKLLKHLGEQALAVVQKVPGVRDVELSVKAGYPEIIVEMDRVLLASRGIPPGQVATRLRTEVQGDIATRFNRSGEKVDIRVRTDKELLSSVEDLKRISVTDTNPPIPLEDVAHIRVEEGPSEIRRIDQRQVVLILANTEDRDLKSVSDDIWAAVQKLERPAGYYFLEGGQQRELETSQNSLRFALILAIFLVYVVMACQFESIFHPALVMFTVPMAFIGVIYPLAWSGTDLSIMVFLGGIILAGIVVNNAIVLVDYINQLRARGVPKRIAVVEAGKVRLRPILMTTITTVLGLVPMISGTGEGSELRRPMALTVMSGLSSATILTLVIIPMVYYLFGGKDRPGTTEDKA